MIEILLASIPAIISTATLGVATIIGKSLKGYIDEQNRRHEKNVELLHSLARINKDQIRDMLLQKLNYHLDKGYLPEDDREILMKSYETYKSPPFNGNGCIDDKYERVMLLPTHKED